MTGSIKTVRGKPHYFLDGKRVTKRAFDKAFPDQPLYGARPAAPKKYGHWPMLSEAMGVHPKQIELARKLDRDRGAPPTNYTSDGRPVLTSEAHKRAFLKAHKVHDRNSYL